jgi:CBS domain-containing protein
VDRNGSVRGLLTLSRVKELDPAHRAGTTVGELATPLDEVVRSRPEEPVVDLIPRLGASPDGRALVFDRGELVGILTPTDVVRMSEMAMLRVGH